MSIASAITTAQQRVAAAYSACDAKGATMPAEQNLSNLPACINTISAGLGDHDVRYLTYSSETVTNEQTGDSESSFILNENVQTVSSTSLPSFQSNTALFEVEIPSAVNTIPTNGFNGCTNLRVVRGTEYIEYLGGYSFYGANNFKHPIYFPKLKGSASSTTALYNTVFKGSAITSVRSLGSITSLLGTSSHGAFQDCTSLASVKLPSTLRSIGYNSFDGCTALTTVNLDDLPNLTTIERAAFKDCSKLTGVIHLPSLTGTLGNEAFMYTKITSITSLGSITTIATGPSSGCFASCTSLTSAVLPDTLSYIGARAFYSCTALTTVNVPSALTNLLADAFRSNSKLTAFDASGTQGNGLTIGTDCFRGDTLLITVKLPTDVVFSGGFQFAEQGGQTYNATTAGNIDFSLDMSLSANTTLSACTFYRSKIQHVVSLGSITTIAAANSNRGVFEGSTFLLDAVLPATLTSLGTRAFYGCTHLTTLTCLAETPPTFGSNALYNTSALTNIYVPSDSVSAYQSASGWSSFASKISAIA